MRRTLCGLFMFLVVVGCVNTTGVKVDKPSITSAVPIVSRLGWWSHQNDLVVTNLNVQITDDTLNLFKCKTDVCIRIDGFLREEDQAWRPFIKELNISERFLQGSTNDPPVADMLITPVIDLAEDSKGSSNYQPFAVRIDAELSTFSWGTNRFRVRCGEFTREFVLFQGK